jgi:hypothetical protein
MLLLLKSVKRASFGITFLISSKELKTASRYLNMQNPSLPLVFTSYCAIYEFLKMAFFN